MKARRSASAEKEDIFPIGNIPCEERWSRYGVGWKAVLELCRELGESAPAAAETLAAPFIAEHGAKETIERIVRNVSSMARKMTEALGRGS